MPPPKPLIVTVKMDASSFEFFDDLRRRYFPPERNFISAHITLFHHLPGGEISAVENDLKNIASAEAEIKLSFSEMRFLGRGTAIEVDSPKLISLRIKMVNKWQERLTAQDRQKFKPHITVQNKVEPKAAKIFYEKLKAGWQIRKGNAVGFQLWHYLDGPWQLAGEFPFKQDGK